MSAPGGRRIRRWLWRGALGAIGFVMLAVLGALVAMQTRWGRELVRAQVEQRLAATFTGGATLGGIEGNPFSELTLHDVVINGADRRPAITVKHLTVAVGVLPLLSHQARVAAVHADGVDIDLRRDRRGALVTQDLLRPGPSSAWSVALPDVAIRHGHIRYDTGSEVVDLDGLDLDAWAELPHAGPVDAGVSLRGTWRERGAAPLVLQTVVHTDADKQVIALPYVTAKAGDVAVIGNRVTVRIAAAEPGQPARAPLVSGDVYVDAGAAAVARLVPTVHLPADVVLQVTATPVPGDRWTAVTVGGRVDRTPVRFTGTADLDARQARGELVTGALDLTRLTGGKLAGRGAATVVFDVRPGGPGALPVASATIRGWGEVAGVPRTDLDIVVSSAGERARAVVKATGRGVRAELAAWIRTAGDRLTIEDATLRADATDPARATGGKAPVHGALTIDLRARGALRPAPDLAIAGTVEGRRLRMADLAVGALHVAVDARQLPARPLGMAHVQLVDLVRRDMQLGELTVDAADRPDGKLAVSVRSRPKQNPWLIDADAVVTPPADLGTGRFAIDLVGHHVRAGSGADWYGKTGHIDIGPERIALRDLASKSPIGQIALGGSYQRAGRHRGDLAADLDVRSLTLENLAGALSGEYHGKVDAHVAVTRTDGAWQGDVRLDGHGVSIPVPVSIAAPAATSTPMFDGHVEAGLHGRRLTVAVDATSAQLGRARLAVDAEAPRAVADPAAWQRLGRDAIQRAQLTLRGIEVRRAAELAGLPGDYGGRIHGDLELTATTAGGRIEVHDLVAPQLHGIGITAALELSQNSRAELTPRLTVTAERTGTLTAQAELAMPDRPFDPAAWRRLGRDALRGASARVEGVAIDPTLLDRLGVTTQLRGRATAAIDLGPAVRTAQATVDLGALRGGPLDQPIDVHVTASLDDRATTATVSVGSHGASLIAVEGRLPVSLVDVLERRGQAAGRDTPLDATAQLTSTDAARLLAVLGRTEITSGRIDGAVKLTGTLGAPRATVRLTASQLTIPPGPHNKPVRVVERLAIDGSWDGATAQVTVDGTESDGGALQLAAQLRPDRLRDGTATIKATRFDLVPLLVFAPGPAGGAAGVLDADLKLTGLDLRTAQLAGELHLKDARIPTAPSVGTLRAAKIDALVADHEIRVAVDGKLGAGTASLTGTIALDGAAPNGGKARLTLHKVSPIGSVEPEITATVDATLSRDRNQWKADLVVDHADVFVPSDRGEKLKPVGAPPDMVFADGRRMTQRPMEQHEPTNPIFVVKVNLRSTRVESKEFRGLIHGQLEMRADGEAIAMYGGIEAERGDLDLFSRRYQLDHAAINFDGSLDPLLDIRITYDFPQVTTVTEVRGRLSKPELVMTSDPGTFSQDQLLGFLLGGEPGGDPQSGPLQSQVAAAGQSLVANQISGYVKKALPINLDVLRYEAATATSGAAVTVGTWLTPSLFLAYRQHLDSRPDENVEEGELEYWLSRRVILQGTAGATTQSLDLLWRKRY
ncbi:MAG TPA: translocation/assembly module TamB domain-containing protein [Kofleriaceae bacterium]|nr:translocation/assembly module TamB domain-containing protein [Kofleriaceae bacterium]